MMTSSRDAALALQQAREYLATDLSEYLNKHWADTSAIQQFDRLTMYFHLDNLSEALYTANPAIFMEYARWLEVLLRENDVSNVVLPDAMEATKAIIAGRIGSPHAEQAASYIDLTISQLGAPRSLPAPYTTEDAPLAELASSYLEALLATDRHTASQLILDAVEQGTSIKDLYLHVFQVAQYEVGRLWQINRITVAQEHYCTAATQFIMSQLYPYIFSTERNGHRMVATSISGELHELGIRMVADFFEMAGWDTYYLGASTPVASIISEVIARRADILAVSVMLHTHMPRLRTLTEQIRATNMPQPVRILVGGYPFNANPDLWKSVGADGSAPDAQQAVALASQLVGLTDES